MAESFANGMYTDSAVGHALQTTAGQFIPEIWSAQLLRDLDSALVLSSSTVTNRAYEGEFRNDGDVVRIPHFVDTVRDFGVKKAYAGFTADEMDRAQLEYIKMTIANGSSFRFQVDRLHQWQTKAGIDLMSDLVRQRGRVTAQTLDKLVAQTIMAAVAGKDLNGSGLLEVPTDPGDFDALPPLHDSVEQIELPASGNTRVYDTIVDMITYLDLNNAPQDRHLFIAPNIRAELLKTPNFIDASHWGGTPVMPTGVIGTILGVPVTVSNTLRNASSTHAKKLVKAPHTGASNIHMLMTATNAVSVVIPQADMGAYQPEDDFTQVVKSRVIYDAKVIRPEQLVVCGDYEAPEEDEEEP